MHYLLDVLDRPLLALTFLEALALVSVAALLVSLIGAAHNRFEEWWLCRKP